MKDQRQEPQYLVMAPLTADSKAWVAEITGRDETYGLKREFHPETEKGVWAIYDGWYQLNGQTPNITPFVKEYVQVEGGRMTRRHDFRDVLAQISLIEGREEVRFHQRKGQIIAVLEEIKAAVPEDLVIEDMNYQIEALDEVESAEALLHGLRLVLQRKEAMIKQYQAIYSNPADLYGS